MTTSTYEALVDEARRVGWSVHLLIAPVSCPSRSRYSRLQSIVLLDGQNEAIASESLLQDDRLDQAAAVLIGRIRERRS